MKISDYNTRVLKKQALTINSKIVPAPKFQWRFFVLLATSIQRFKGGFFLAIFSNRYIILTRQSSVLFRYNTLYSRCRPEF